MKPSPPPNTPDWVPEPPLAYKIALAYALFGSLWILLSGYLLHGLVREPKAALGWEIAKGAFFVLVTAVLLGLTLRRYLRRVQRSALLIQQNEQRLHSLFENMLNGLAYCRMINDGGQPRDFIYLDVNSAFEKLTGLKDVIGKRVTEVIPGIREADPGLFESYDRVVRTGVSERFETYVEALKMWFAISVYCPSPEHFVAVFDVITERKRAEAALRESEERLRSLGDNLPESYVYQYVHEAGGRTRFIYLSAGVEKLHGVKASDVLGDASVLHRQIAPEQFAAMAAAEAASLHTLTDFQMELHMCDSGGQWRWLHVRSRPRRRPDGEVLWDGVATDITARKQAEDALNYHRAILEETGRIASVGGWSIDAITGAGSWTNEVARIHDLDPALPISMEAGLRYYSGESRAKIEAAVKNAVEQGISYDLELEIVSAKGIHKWVRTIGHPVTESGRVVRVHGSFQDITERRRAEEEIHKLNAELEQRVIERTAQLAAANQELEAFSYSVSHDLRAPLRAMDGFARILTEHSAGQLDQEGVRMLGIIRGETTRMGQLIDDLLAFSRLGRRQMQSSEIDMVALAGTVFAECAARASERKLRFNVSPLPPATGDQSMIRQVLTNLLSNAIKYSQPRAMAEIEMGSREEEKKETVYWVRDNGVGFDMKYAGKLFGIFQRLHSEEEFEGTGVGLALVQRIIARHGGRVWAESKLNEGACFYFSLPRRTE